MKLSMLLGKLLGFEEFVKLGLECLKLFRYVRIVGRKRSILTQIDRRWDALNESGAVAASEEASWYTAFVPTTSAFG